MEFGSEWKHDREVVPVLKGTRLHETKQKRMSIGS